MNGLPYLRAIELLLIDHFPNRKIKVWDEKAMFNPYYVTIKARVDEAGAYVDVDVTRPVTESEISDILIAKLEEVL